MNLNLVRIHCHNGENKHGNRFSWFSNKAGSSFLKGICAFSLFLWFGLGKTSSRHYLELSDVTYHYTPKPKKITICRMCKIKIFFKKKAIYFRPHSISNRTSESVFDVTSIRRKSINLQLTQIFGIQITNLLTSQSILDS